MASLVDLQGRSTATGGASLVRIFDRVLRDLDVPSALRFGNATHALKAGAEPVFTVVIHELALLKRLALDPSPLALVDAYCAGEIDIEGDFYRALSLKDHFDAQGLSWRVRFMLLKEWAELSLRGRLPDASGGWAARGQPAGGGRHSRTSDRAAISFHYDVSNEFYGLWLDAERVYSCAYFEDANAELDQAQARKLDYICRKLRLQPGDRFLDVGCGWGALVRWAAKYYGARAHGITLSQQQWDYARQRIDDDGLSKLARVDLCDYRDLPKNEAYDKVASVGMFEHVGLANLPVYFSSIFSALKPGGLFLNHGITHDEDGWQDNLDTRFINQYVFPGGELDRLSQVQLGMERAGFEIHDVEGLRPHYALTLRHWVRRLEANREAALRVVDEPTYRMWRLYMAACALSFESGETGVYQILVSRRHQGQWSVPLCRKDLYVEGRGVGAAPSI